MAYSIKPTTELIRFVRGTKDQFEQINKRNDTLYFIYENNDSTTGELYLGNKQIGDGTGSITTLSDLITGTVGDGDLLIYDQATENWMSKPIDEALRIMTGATELEDGQSGLVPVPQAGDQNKFLRADGTWANPVATTSVNIDTQTLEFNSNDEITLKGFSEASVGSLLQKTATGLAWISAPTITNSIKYTKVEDLSEVVEEGTIYFVPNNSNTDNIFNEYMYIDGKPELIGTTGEINLSNYVTLSNFNSTVGNLYTSLGAKADQADLDALSITVDEMNERLTWQEITED